MVTNAYRISKRRKNILRISPVSYYLRTPKGINVCKHTATATYHHFHDLHQLSCDIPDLLHPTLFEKRLILNHCISISKMSPLQFQFHVMHWKYVGRCEQTRVPMRFYQSLYGSQMILQFCLNV